MRARQNSKLFSSALVLALLLTAGTLIAQDVRYNFMPRTDFSKYRTYKWVNIRGAHPDQIMDAEIMQSVDSQLASKGMTKTKQLVWTGRAIKTIDPGSNHEKNIKNLDKAMAKLLKNYPPKQK